MSEHMSWALLCGFGLGIGLWTMISGLPAFRRVSFAERIAPHLRAGTQGSRILGANWAEQAPLTPFGELGKPLFEQLKKLATRFSPGSQTLKIRLMHAGLQLSVIEYRAQQLFGALLGLILGALTLLGLSFTGMASWAASTFAFAGFALAGYLGRDWYLGQQIKSRRRRILTQFPTVAEVMALAVGAGESAIGSIERIAVTCKGVLGDEFTLVLKDIHAGATAQQALEQMSHRVQLGPITRFVDAIVVATERGTPLGQVMRDQAQDVRDASKRELMEMAGRKEVEMLIPIIFGVLPLTVVFAVFPGLSLLELSY